MQEELAGYGYVPCSLHSFEQLYFLRKPIVGPGSKYTLFVYLSKAGVVWLDAIYFHIHQISLYVLELLYLFYDVDF